MSSNAEYIKDLIERSKQGRKPQFVELSISFLPRIYSIVFGLVPNMEVAKKVCAEVFYIVWKKIKSIESDSDLLLHLGEIAIVRSFMYLQNVEEIELDGLAIQNITKGDPNFFTKVEREFLKLTYIQRVILVLNDKLELPTNRIAEVLKTLNEEEIREELHSAREILLKKFPDGKLAEFPEHGWAILNDCLMKLDKGIDQYLEDEVVEFISEYLQQSKNLLDGIFGKITPNDEIVDYLKDYLLKDTSNKKTKKDLTKFSENYKSVSANSTDVLFEKAFTTPPKPNIDEKLAAPPISGKNTKTWLALVIGFVSIAILSYFFLNSSANSWNLERGNGVITLNGSINHVATLNEGDKISTNNHSRTEICNSNSSNIVLLDKCNLTLTDINNDYTIFSLLDGTLLVDNTAYKGEEITPESRLIKIKANGLEIISKKGLLSIKLSKNDGLNLEIESGFAKVLIDASIYYLTENYRFIQNQNNKYFLPFRINANAKLIESIKTLNPLSIDNVVIMEIIKHSSKNDYLTLFNLFLISDLSSRKLLLNKLNEYYPLKTFFVWKNLIELKKRDVEFLTIFLFENPF